MGRHPSAARGKPLGRLLTDPAARWHGVEHHIGGLAGARHDERVSIPKVEGGGATRDEHQVGCPRGEGNYLVGVRRGVEPTEVRPSLLCGGYERRGSAAWPAC